MRSDTASARDRLIVKSTIELAHSLGMAVVAEGVENRFVLGALADMGCDVAQGWLFAPALPLDEFRAFLTRDAAPGEAQAA
ncbi:MAG: EAL domain-containing protein [Alphaproteobacteria bacterium]|nr:EAL domain-containing protein [Alphaproteobacteria bacterium]